MTQITFLCRVLVGKKKIDDCHIIYSIRTNDGNDDFLLSSVL